MSRTLVYRTSKEFDKCAEHLRNILNVQESRQDSKSPSIRKVNRKKQQQQQSPINIRPKKQNSKTSPTKSSFIKTNINHGKEIEERRSPHSSNKTLHAPNEEPSRLISNKHQRLISPLKLNQSQKKSPLLFNEEELIRSSSCGDLPSSTTNLMSKEQTCFILDKFITHLTRIKTLSKQIQIRNPNSECYYLWNELEKSLSSALSYANHDLQLQLSLTPLRTEIFELRKQLQTTNIHLHKSDLSSYHNNEQYVDLQKKFNTNQIQCRQLLLHNQELKTKCYLLQNKLDHLQRNNTNLIQRLTQQDVRSISKNIEWISTDNCFLLRKEILFLKDKLYHVYDDLSILFDQNQTLEKTIREQKQQLLLYKHQFKDLKQSAEQILNELDNRFIEDKIRTFLNNIIIDQQKYQRLKSSFHENVKAVNFSDIPYTPSSVLPIQSHIPPTTKFRPKSLFITPNILNDSNILSKFPNQINDKRHFSSSTIDDADSTLTSSSSSSSSSSSISLYYQRENSTNVYNSLPSLTINITKLNGNTSNNESTPEFDQISDLTSKMFSTSDEEELPNGNIYISSSSSSSTIPSDSDRLMHI